MEGDFFSFLFGIDDAVLAFVHEQVVWGPVFLLFIEEAGVPIPVPGDIVIAYTGYQISKGAISYWMAFGALLLAVVGGSSLLYFFSARWGQKIVLKLGRFMHINEEKLGQLEKRFRKYGPLAIIVGRHIPGLRIPITVFAGMSGVSYKSFVISTLLSIALWIGFYLQVGAKLGPKTARLFHSSHGSFLIATLFIVALIAGYLYLNARRRK